MASRMVKSEPGLAVDHTVHTVEDDEDEWEEQILVAQVDGVLDAQILRDAVNDGKVAVRRIEHEKPIIQIGGSLYTGNWQLSLGTNILLQAVDGQLKVASVSDRMLKAEKALLTQNQVTNQQEEQPRAL